jgi:(p)ppGpp synthase/HD superfamily hydrolase
MVSRSTGSTEVRAPAAVRRTQAKGARQADRATTERGSSLARAALRFAVHCHTGQQRKSDGAAFIEHPLEVARLLRDAGCSDVLVTAGLLHDVVAEAHVSADELTARFGSAVADLVLAVTDDSCVHSYRQRKQVLREQVRNAGADAALLFVADEIAELRELPAQIGRDWARFDMGGCESRAREHVQHYHQMRLEHYRESVEMLQRVAPRQHPLVQRLADDLEEWPSTADHVGRRRP